MRREPIDLHAVPDYQQDIHIRLLNWANWVRVRPHYETSPMFRALGARSNSRQWHAPGARPTVDMLDAMAIEKTMRHLPERNRVALQWHYLYAFLLPHKVCRLLAVSRDGLNLLVCNGRSMVLANLSRNLV